MQDLLTTECVCGERETDVLGRKDNRSVGKCTACGLIRTLERDPNYVTLYTEGDRYHEDRDGHTPYRERYDHDFGIAAVRWPKLVRNFSLLDVGCANGAFVKYAQRMGMRAEGLELNPHMAAWAREKTGLTVHTSWEDVSMYDVVTMHDVFEHAEDPVAQLEQVWEHLFTHGLLVIDLPDAGHEDFVKAPMASHHTKPLEHLWFWDEKNLTELLHRNGFVVAGVDRPIPGKLVVYARCVSYA